jgi:hypothetical protein
LLIHPHQFKHDNVNKEFDDVLDITPRNVQASYDKLKTIQNMLEVYPELGHESNNINNKNISKQVKHDSIKVFHDISMEDTLGPRILLNSTNNLTKINSYINPIIDSNNVDIISNSMNGTKNFNKENNYELSLRFNNREESFHRITSDELNTLCASMNLPTLRYSKNESVQNNYIPLCNDARMPGDSFKNSVNFEKQPIHINNIFLEKNESFNNPVRTCESFHKKNNFRIFYDNDVREQKQDFSLTQTNSIENCVTKEKSLEYKKYQQQQYSKITVYHDDSINLSNNLESLNKSINHNISDIASINSSQISNSFHSVQNENNCKISQIITAIQTSVIKIPINNLNNKHCDINLPRIQTCIESSTDKMHKRIDALGQNTKSLFTKVHASNEVQKNVCNNIEHERFQTSNIQISHDISMESSNMNNNFKKFHENTLNKTDITLNVNEIADSSMEIYINPDNDKNDAIRKEHNLNRVPSDNTCTLLATMDVKSELHPLIRNNKKTKVLNNPQNKTYDFDLSNDINKNLKRNKTNITHLNMHDKNKKNEKENVIEIMETSAVSNINKINKLDKDYYLNNENIQISEKIYLLPENDLEELDAIQPPSFLCSDSIQSDSFDNIVLVNNNYSNILVQNINETNISLSVFETENNRKSGNLENNLPKGLKRYSNDDSSNLNELPKKLCKLSTLKNKNNRINELVICKNKEITEKLTPILLLIEDIQNYVKRYVYIYIK